MPRSSYTSGRSRWCVLGAARVFQSFRPLTIPILLPTLSHASQSQSRAAAVNELLGGSQIDCEVAYETALWMLYAILDETMQDGERVEEDDKETVEKFIGSIRSRLAALRRKMESRGSL